MNNDTNNTRSTDNNSDEEYFIDDYSHVMRFSYYQDFDDQETLTTNLSNEDLNLTLNESDSLGLQRDIENHTVNNYYEDYVKKIRDKYVRQKTNLPHPAHVVGNIMASNSSKMGMQFQYNSRIEEN